MSAVAYAGMKTLLRRVTCIVGLLIMLVACGKTTEPPSAPPSTPVNEVPAPLGEVRETPNGKFVIVALGNGRALTIRAEHVVQMECKDKDNCVPLPPTTSIQMGQCPCAWKACSPVCMQGSQLTKAHDGKP